MLYLMKFEDGLFFCASGVCRIWLLKIQRVSRETARLNGYDNLVRISGVKP